MEIKTFFITMGIIGILGLLFGSFLAYKFDFEFGEKEIDFRSYEIENREELGDTFGWNCYQKEEQYGLFDCWVRDSLMYGNTIDLHGDNLYYYVCFQPRKRCDLIERWSK